MMAVNLLPAASIAMMRRHRRAHLWTRILAAYVLLLGAGWFAVANFLHRDDRGVSAKLEAVGIELKSLEQSVRGINIDLGKASASIAAARAVGEHPDWSILLKMLATLKGDELLFDDCELKPRATEISKTKPDPLRPAGYLLRLKGIGKDQQSIMQFSLRLEGAGLFDRVTLVDTKGQQFLGAPRVAFTIECTLEEVGRVGA